MGIRIDRRRLSLAIRPCPIRPGDPERRPYRLPFSNQFRGRSRKQIAALSLTVFAMTGILIANQMLIAFVPAQVRTSYRYDIEMQLIRTDNRGDPLWTKTIRIANGTGEPDTSARLAAITECNDGGFAVASQVLNRADGMTHWQLMLVRIDSSGILQWTRVYDGLNLEADLSLVQVPSEGFAIAGTTRHFDDATNHWDHDVFVIRTDTDGNPLWSRTYSEPTQDWGSSLIHCASGGFAVAGKTGDSRSDTMLLRIDSEGEPIWRSCLESSSRDAAYSLIECKKGGFAVSGNTQNVMDGHTGVLAIRFDENGIVQWNCTYHEFGNRHVSSMLELTEGGFIIAGSKSSLAEPFIKDTMLLFVDSNGRFQSEQKLSFNTWLRIYGLYSDCWGSSITRVSTTGFAVVGTIVDHRYNDWNVLLLRTDDNGNHLWNRTYGGPSWEVGYSVVDCSTGGFVIAGLRVSLAQ